LRAVEPGEAALLVDFSDRCIVSWKKLGLNFDAAFGVAVQPMASAEGF
jgi:hypothetical protein